MLSNNCILTAVPLAHPHNSASLLSLWQSPISFCQRALEQEGKGRGTPPLCQPSPPQLTYTHAGFQTVCYPFFPILPRCACNSTLLGGKLPALQKDLGKENTRQDTGYRNCLCPQRLYSRDAIPPATRNASTPPIHQTWGGRHSRER